MKCTPATYIASLYRQILMKEPLETAFTGNSRLLQEFQEKNGNPNQLARTIDKGRDILYSGYYQSRRYSSLAFIC